MRIAPLSGEALADLAPLLERVEQSMGFLPNSMRTMARVPGLAQGLSGLAAAVWAAPRTSAELKGLVAVAVSQGAGCRYCQAHTAHRASHVLGVHDAKLDALWAFEASDLFTAAERAALRMAIGAGQSPSAVTDAEMGELKRHFDDDAIAELVAVVALFGFLNRWNDTLGTELESAPLAFAEKRLAPAGWTAGKHRAG